MLAAEQGHMEAQYILGIYTYQMSPPDNEEASKWYMKESEQGDISTKRINEIEEVTPYQQVYQSRL